MTKKIVIRVSINGNSPHTMKKIAVDFLKLRYLKECWGYFKEYWGHKPQSTCSKNQSKVLSIAAKIGEIEKVAIEGEEKNELMVMGEGIDVPKLVTRLRKKVGFADVVSVEPVDKKKEEKPEEKPIVPWVPPLQYWEVRDPYYCSLW